MTKDEIKNIYSTYADAWKLYKDILTRFENTDEFADEVVIKMKQFETEHPEEKWFAHELMTVFYARLTGGEA